jgi:hypothetical protein
MGEHTPHGHHRCLTALLHPSANFQQLSLATDTWKAIRCNIALRVTAPGRVGPIRRCNLDDNTGTVQFCYIWKVDRRNADLCHKMIAQHQKRLHSRQVLLPKHLGSC